MKSHDISAITDIPVARKSFYSLIGKRFLDIALSAGAIVLLSPIILMTALLVLIFIGRPLFFFQERPGLYGQSFKMWKFRSMTNERDAEGELLPNEARLTRFGVFIRKFSLDELPELFLVLIGKMSIIGPRPLRMEYLPLYSPRHSHRHDVRPGLACLILEPKGKTMTWNDQFENDIYYIENVSLYLDIRMVSAIVKEIIHPSRQRAYAGRSKFTGDNLDE